MNKPACYLICGFLGAGKTTYSKKLAAEIGAVHLNPDEWCMKLFSKAEYSQNWSACFSKTVDYLWEKTKECAKDGQSVVFDMGFWTRQSRQDAIKKVRTLGFSPKIHYIYAPDDILKQRISKRSGIIADYNLKHFDEIKKQFEEPDASERFVLINNYSQGNNSLNSSHSNGVSSRILPQKAR